MTPGSSGQDELNTLVAALERKSITREQLLQIGRLSKDLPVKDDNDSTALLWQGGNVYGRIVDQLSKTLRDSKVSKYSFISLTFPDVLLHYRMTDTLSIVSLRCFTWSPVSQHC